MGYLGLTPTTAQQNYLNIDDISGSFNGTTTSFALQVGGVAPVPFPVTNSCLISVGGVIQQPDDTGTDGFRISGGNIIFSSAPGTGEDFFGLVLAGADYLNVGANFPDGTVGTPSITFESDLNTGIYHPSADSIAITSGGTAALTVDSNQRVGVGTSSPDQVLHITSPGDTRALITSGGTGDAVMMFENASGNNWGHGLDLSSGNYVIAYKSSGNPSLTADGKLNIDSSGRLGLGTSSPGVILDVAAGTGNFPRLTSSAADPYLRLQNTSAAGKDWLIYCSGTGSGAAGAIRVYNNTDDKLPLTLDSSGRVGIGTTSPTAPLEIVATTGQPILKASASTGTNGCYSQFSNTAGALIVGRDNSSGGVLGGGAYASHIYSQGAYPLVFSTDSTQRAQIDSSGRLLVGTSTSVGSGSGQYAKLQVGPSTFGSTSGGKISIQRGEAASAISSGSEIGQLVFSDNAGGDYAFITVRSDAAGGSSDYPGRIEFSTTADGASSPTERMRISSTGNVDIGSVSGPSGSVSSTGFRFMEGNGFWWSTTGANSYWNVNTQTYFNFRYNGSGSGAIIINNGSVNYNTSSDYRIKENVVPLIGAIDRIKQLQVHRFNFLANPNKTVDGFIAHEVQDIVPEAISGTKDEVDNAGSPVYQGIDQSKLVPLLTAALQEAIGRIETLEAEVAALKGA